MASPPCGEIDITEDLKTRLAGRMFDGAHAESELEEQLFDAGVSFSKIGFDPYDCSIELYGLPNDFRLSEEVQKIIYAAGFAKAYCNHQDKWETHYAFDATKDFAMSKGWRVSYPHKRGDDEKAILVEEFVPTWPKEWFDDGKVKILR